MIAALRAAGGVEPLIVGKPAPGCSRRSSGTLRGRAARTLVIGDNPDSDMIAAHRRRHALAVLVLTGIADAETAAELTANDARHWWLRARRGGSRCRE